MNREDKSKFITLTVSLASSPFDTVLESNPRDTECLYRFGWFYINNYKYSISAWSFKKNIVTFEREDGLKVKYSIDSCNTIFNTFKKDTKIQNYQKRLRNSLADWLKDLSDKLRI